MKKKFVILLAAALAVSFAVCGCGKKGNVSGSSAGSESSSAQEEADTKIPAEELLAATDYDVEDYVTLNDYRGMKVIVDKKYEPSEENLKTYANTLLAQYPSYEATDKKTVEDQDIVNIDYEGKIDGESFDGGTAEGYHLQIGSDSFIDGFEDGLIGKKVGETAELNLKFPDDYSANTELAGKDVVFTVKVNSIDREKQVTYDDLTDEYVAGYFGSGGITTVKAFKDQIQYVLDSSSKAAIQTAVIEKLEKECKVTLPDGLADQRMEETIGRIKEQAETQKKSFEEYVGAAEDEYKKEMTETLEKNLKQELILEAIVKKENISISSREFSNFVSAYVSSYGLENEEAFYKQYGDENYVKLSYAENQAALQVADMAKVSYEDAEKVSGEDNQGDQASAEDQK